MFVYLLLAICVIVVPDVSSSDANDVSLYIPPLVPWPGGEEEMLRHNVAPPENRVHDESTTDEENALMSTTAKRAMSMLRMGRDESKSKRSMSMLRMGRQQGGNRREKLSMSMLRMGRGHPSAERNDEKRSMSMLRMGRTPTEKEEEKRSMSMLRMGRSQEREDKRSMSMLRMGRTSDHEKRSMSMLRMGRSVQRNKDEKRSANTLTTEKRRAGDAKHDGHGHSHSTGK